MTADAKSTKGLSSKANGKQEEELSAEDAKLKEELALLVERIGDSEEGVALAAVTALQDQIRSATASVTSVPKPLKFLRGHYDTVKDLFKSLKSTPLKPALADVLSVLGMTMAESGTRECLRFKLQGNREDLGSWGHQYVRTLAGEIGLEYQVITDAESEKVDEEGAKASMPNDVTKDDLMQLVKLVIPFFMEHNAEPEAVDLLLEVDSLKLIIDVVSVGSAQRTCLYLSSCASYLPEPDYSNCLKIVLDIFLKIQDFPEALRVALRLNEVSLMRRVFKECEDGVIKKQLAFILGRQGAALTLDETEIEIGDEQEREGLFEIASNANLSASYLALAKDLDVLEAKTPEDVYKAHLVEGRLPNPSMDSAKANLAKTFVNAFVNSGFCNDKLMTRTDSEEHSTDSDEQVNWLYKTKEYGKMSAVASLGSIMLWDVDTGLAHLDKYQYTSDPFIKGGAFLGIGILSSGIRSEVDPAFALLSEPIQKEHPAVRMGAILGMGIAYAGTSKMEILDILCEVVSDTDAAQDVVTMAALSLGLVFVGSCLEKAAQAILEAFDERGELELTTSMGRLMAVGLGLLFLNKQEAVDPTVEIVKTLKPSISKCVQTIVESCAYAASGNVLKVQEMLSICTEATIAAHEDSEQSEEEASKELKADPIAIIGLSLISIGEELGSQMALRSLNHILQYGGPEIRRTVPLALALISTSKPDLMVVDTLSRLSHDSDTETAEAAILAMGIVSAGTNNARVAGLLRSLSSYYYKDHGPLFCVRIAQGLTHLGKGLLSLSPFRSPGILCPQGLAGLIVLIFTAMDMKSTLLNNYHFMLYSLVPAMWPRMLSTVDEELKPLNVSVRVGQAVDVVGQAGKPKTITGFQTHTSPVLIAAGERAELATEMYLPITQVLEGIVILKPNPNYVEET